MTIDPLHRRPLGDTALALSRLGFGAGPLGGFYGPVDAAAGADAVRAAYDAGLRHFDVAPLYGHGRAELVLGHGLRDLPRDDYVLSTKVGRWLVPAGSVGQPPRARAEGAPFNPVLDYSAAGVDRAIEQSLQRLGVARIDIVYVHDVDAHSQGSDQAAERAFRAALDGAMPALARMKSAGVIGAIGVGINQPRWAMRWLAEADIDVLMLAGRLTLLNREAESDVLPACRARGVAYVAAGAFNGGLLARGGEATAWRFNYRPAPDDVIERYRKLSAIAVELGVDLKAAALQFVLARDDVASVVVGMASAAEVTENLDLARVPIPDAFWRRADALATQG